MRQNSIAICVFIKEPTEASLFRLPIEPDERNGPRSSSRLIEDNITAVPKSKVGERIGRPDDEDLVRLSQAMIVFLAGLVLVSPSAARFNSPAESKYSLASPKRWAAEQVPTTSPLLTRRLLVEGSHQTWGV